MTILDSAVEFEGGNPSRKTVGYLVKPEEMGTYPAIIVIHEIWGLVDHIKDVSRRIARAGYVTLAVDLFDGESFNKIEEGRKLLGKFTQEKILSDIYGAFKYLRNLDDVDPDHIGSIGFCMGGGLSLLFACTNPDLAAAAVFYGRNPSPIDQVKNIVCPVLASYAGEDHAITESDINLLNQTMKTFGKTFDYKIYSNSPHGFFNDTRENYRADAAKDSWERTLEFFGENLTPGNRI